MTEDDALAFLEEIAGDLVQDKKAVRELCKKLGYLAFAIEIAGRTMQASDYSARDLLHSLENVAVAELAVPLEFSEKGRETVAALIQTSLDVLPKETQNVFFAWGAFWSTKITAEMMANYLEAEDLDSDNPVIDNFMGALESLLEQSANQGPDIAEAENALNTLHRYGLATRQAAVYEGEEGQYIVSAAHYILHELGHLFAQAQIGIDEQSRALDACLSYYGTLQRTFTREFCQTCA